MANTTPSPRPISEIAASVGIPPDRLVFYGTDKAKIRLSVPERAASKPDGHLILVTAINPTPAGEGKTTTAIGVADGMRRIGKKSIVTLREPSLGPVFGVKGGATGGGLARIVPSDDINLHFTGDFHAVTSAHNLLSAMLDSHIHHGNSLDFDMRRTIWKRAIDMNDRSLRRIVIGLGGRDGGYTREERFDITAASEIMAILALSSSLDDLRERISNIVVGFSRDGAPIRAKALQAAGAMTALLKDAIHPNLVQTLEGTPAIVHCGPFANIAHGCNSLVATRLGLQMGDYVFSEAGFGCDLGGEKFLDIFCPAGKFTPSAAILVATIRALKYHGGQKISALDKEDVNALNAGLPNLEHHIETLKRFGVPTVVAINRFHSDSEKEIRCLEERLTGMKQPFALCEGFEKGGLGATKLAEQVVELTSGTKSGYRPIYDVKRPLKEKIEMVAQKIYGASGVDYQGRSRKQLETCADAGFSDAYICFAKTQYSLSDDPKKLGRPKDFRLTIREVRLLGGARFVVPICGEMMTMPGLPKEPAAIRMDLDSKGNITYT